MMAVVSALAGTTFTVAWGLCRTCGICVRFSGEGNMASLTLPPAGSIANALPAAQWRAAGNDKVQWTVEAVMAIAQPSLAN